MPGYETRIDRVTFPAEADLIVRSLADLQQYSDPDRDAERAGVSSANWPLFGRLWPSGRILAEHVASIAIADRRVLEIGCGLGLASMVMRRGGADVTATDIHPLAGAFLLANIALNELAGVPFHQCAWAASPPELGRFGLLVGSDLLYEPSHARDLADFIDRHAEVVADVIIVDPNRGHRAEFRRLMQGHAFVATTSVAPAMMHGGAAYRGQLLRFSRS